MSEKIDKFPSAWLVWVHGSGGQMHPQIWYEPFVGTAGSAVIEKHKLPAGAETHLSLDSLAELYPLARRAA